MSSNANLYGVGSSGTSLSAAGVLPVIRPSNPSSSDLVGPGGQFVVGQIWINSENDSSFQLTSIHSSNGAVTATWTVLGGGSSSLNSLSGDTGTAFPTSGDIQIAGGAGISTSASGSTVTIALDGGGLAIDSITTQTGTTPVVPDGTGLISISGAVVAAGTNPIRSDGTGSNALAIEVQKSQAIASTDATKIGLSAFNSSDFTVDANGFVSSIGGGFTRTVGVQAHTAPGTDPVVPTAGGEITVDGGTVVAGTTPVQTNSLAANTYTIQVQTSQAIASADATKIGLSNFNSSDFTVDSTGFVSSIGGGFTRTVGVDAATAPGTDPVVPTAGGLITVTGGQIAASSTANVIQTNSLSANTYTIQVQRATTAAVPTVGDNGVCHFNEDEFTVDSNGFVEFANPPIIGVSVNSGTTPITPDASGKINLVGVTAAAGAVAPVNTVGGALSTISVAVQLASAQASSDDANAGLCSFDSSSFSVDANGYVTLSGGGAAIDSLIPNSGTSPVVPAGDGSITLQGTGSITTVGGTNSLTPQLTGLTNHNVLLGAGTATITNVAPSSTSGIPLVSNGSSADPSFTTAVVAGGGTGATSFTAYSVLCGGTTSTDPVQNVSGVGSIGQVLTSNGAAALPSWQAAGSIITSGTWSPEININGSATGITYNLNTGTWIRIGTVSGSSIVNVTGNIELSSIGSGSGIVTLANLPVTALASTFSSLTISLRSDITIDSGYSIAEIQVDGGSVVGTFLQMPTGATGNVIALSDTNLTNTSQFYFSGTYQA